MFTDTPITTPPKLHERITALVRDDEDLLSFDRAHAKRQCIRQHHRRTWQKLSPEQRQTLNDANPGAKEYHFLSGIAEILAHSDFWQSCPALPVLGNHQRASTPDTVRSGKIQ